MGIPNNVSDAITYINENLDKFEPKALPTYKPADFEIGSSPSHKYLEDIMETSQQLE